MKMEQALQRMTGKDITFRGVQKPASTPSRTAPAQWFSPSRRHHSQIPLVDVPGDVDMFNSPEAIAPVQSHIPRFAHQTNSVAFVP
jgi:hypothetical protein